MTTEQKPPANPAKGNLQGQSTLASKIDRWQRMNENVLAQIGLGNFPQLKDFQAKFQQAIDDAQALRIQMKVLEADSLSATARRNELIQTGDDLYSRLNHGLRSVLGPKSERLVQYGLKRGKAGRKPKPTPNPGPPAPPPQPEVKGSPAAVGSAEKSK